MPETNRVPGAIDNPILARHMQERARTQPALATRRATTVVGHPVEPDWSDLIDNVLLARLVDYGSTHPDRVDTVYLTGSYIRGTANPSRPNVNVYFIARPGHTRTVRVELGRVLMGIRAELRSRGVDLAVDCHPFTISQRDPAWLDGPLLTLTTKVLDGAAAAQRYGMAPTIGLGWYRSHRVLVGRPDALEVFGRPPRRDLDWLHGAHQALTYYRNILDHLPWALDSTDNAARLFEESFRYAEESMRDGVHIGLSDDELAAGENIAVLFDWAGRGREFYRDRYGQAGVRAHDTVAALKSQLVPSPCTAETAERAWSDALDVWDVVWGGYLRLAERMGAGPHLRRVTAWL